MTYRKKAVNLLMQKMGIKSNLEAQEIVDLVDRKGNYKPSVFGILKAPKEVENWDEEIKENEQKISKILSDEVGYSLKIIEQKEKDLQEQKDILLNFDFEKPITLEKWRQLFLTPLGTFPKSLTEILRNSLSEDIKGLAYVNGKDCIFLWNDIEVTLPATYGKNTPIVYIDTNWFYKLEDPFEKASYLVNTILPKLKEFGCKDIRQWGIMEIDSADMNNKNMDNIVQDVKEHTMENGGEER